MICMNLMRNAIDIPIKKRIEFANSLRKAKNTVEIAGILKKGIIFTFGMYENGCLGIVRGSLEFKARLEGDFSFKAVSNQLVFLRQ